ncbi:uncharacterized protein V1510DRAFT_430592 [Dipodascopsis tothii]|uniref:uncharacterized protein n=1 Tax=Dipodascopsis tothii TaxID=44089 RepID=UPI0034CFA7D3
MDHFARKLQDSLRLRRRSSPAPDPVLQAAAALQTPRGRRSPMDSLRLYMRPRRKLLAMDNASCDTLGNVSGDTLGSDAPDGRRRRTRAVLASLFRLPADDSSSSLSSETIDEGDLPPTAMIPVSLLTADGSMSSLASSASSLERVSPQDFTALLGSTLSVRDYILRYIAILDDLTGPSSYSFLSGPAGVPPEFCPPPTLRFANGCKTFGEYLASHGVTEGDFEALFELPPAPVEPAVCYRGLPRYRKEWMSSLLYGASRRPRRTGDGGLAGSFRSRNRSKAKVNMRRRRAETKSSLGTSYTYDRNYIWHRRIESLFNPADVLWEEDSMEAVKEDEARLAALAAEPADPVDAETATVPLTVVTTTATTATTTTTATVAAETPSATATTASTPTESDMDCTFSTEPETPPAPVVRAPIVLADSDKYNFSDFTFDSSDGGEKRRFALPDLSEFTRLVAEKAALAAADNDEKAALAADALAPAAAF